jgi:predicted transcriptional regulator
MVWRRQQVFSLLVKGTTNTYEIAKQLGISQSTASRDVQFLKAKTIKELSTHLHEQLPTEYKICSEGINKILQKAWEIIFKEDSRANKTATLALIMDCYKAKLEACTNAFVITESLNQIEFMKYQILGVYNSKQVTSESKLSTPIIAPVR